MGWTYYDVRPHGESVMATLRRSIGAAYWDSHVVDAAAPTIGAVYVAHRDELGLVSLTIILTRYGRDGSFGYKVLDETQGLDLDRCPERILRLLSPVEELYASEFEVSARHEAHKLRAACYERLARPRVPKGARLRFAGPIRFTTGEVATDLVFRGGNRFSLVSGYGNLRIPGWRDREFEIVG